MRQLMDQYPDMVIELSSHTDSRGVGAYNQKLSQRRADSAKKWLVAEGIQGDRIKTVGYGEKQLLNRCKDGVRCNEDEHQLNRRTEFKIVAGPQTIQVKKSRLKSEEPAK
jgi:outer membrane protein OmpA-like peptidoglycan-associated protein